MITKQSLFTLTAVLFVGICFLTPELSFAAGGLGAVESEITDILKTIRKIILAVVPILAGIILIWKCVEGMQQQKTPMEIITTCLWIVGAASALEVVTWIFGKFGSGG